MIEIKQFFQTLPCVLKKKCDQQLCHVIDDKEIRILVVLVLFFFKVFFKLSWHSTSCPMGGPRRAPPLTAKDL